MNARTESFIGIASDNDLRIALHYKDAAKVLYKSNAYQDGISLPFLFLIRQFLELALKYNIKKLNEISSINYLMGKLYKVHDLNKIHEAFLQHYRNVKNIQGNKDTSDQEYLDILNTLIKNISSLDSNSQGFRYAENTEKVKIISTEETFDLKAVFELLEDTSNFLAHITDEFGLNHED